MNQKSILIIKLGALGDFIQSLGIMRAIRQAHPTDKIVLLTTKPFEKIATKSGYVDELIIDKRPKWYEPLDWVKLSSTLNKNRFWRVYDLQNNDRTSFYFKLFKPKPQWVGVAKGASHRNTSKDRTSDKAFYGLVQNLSLTSIDNIDIDTLEWMKSEKSFVKPQTPYVLIVPGGAPKHPHKRWPKEHYKDLCEHLNAKNILPVLIGTKDDADATDFIKSKVPTCLDLNGKTDLFDLPTLARAAMAAVGNDTGPMHMIGPTGCKTIVLFGDKTNPKRHSPLGGQVVTLQKENMADISVENVLGAVFD